MFVDGLLLSCVSRVGLRDSVLVVISKERRNKTLDYRPSHADLLQTKT